MTHNFKSIGQDVQIFPQALIIFPENIELGDSVQIDDWVKLVAGVPTKIGSFVHMASFSTITGRGKFVMEDYTALSNGVRIYTGNERGYQGECMTNPTVPEPFRQAFKSEVIIKKHAIIGANCVILPPATIGEGAVVGANSLVTANSNLKPWTIYVGSPAKPLKVRPKKKILELEKSLRAELYTREGKYTPKEEREIKGSYFKCDADDFAYWGDSTDRMSEHWDTMHK